MLKFYLMIVFLTCCQNSFDTTCKRLIAVDGRSKMIIRLSMLRCAGANMLVEYLQMIVERQ